MSENRATEHWFTMLHAMGLEGGEMPDDLTSLLDLLSERSVVFFQLALKGTGFATDELEADGNVGQQTTDSIRLLYKAAFPKAVTR